MEESPSGRSGDPELEQFASSVSVATDDFIQNRVTTLSGPESFGELLPELTAHIAAIYGEANPDPDALTYTFSAHLARDLAIVRLFNKLNLQAFAAVPPHERSIFLPHCLTAGKACMAEEHDRFERCVRCGRCSIDSLVSTLTGYGYDPEKIFIVSGGSVIPSVVRRERVKAILGLACYNELFAYIEAFGGAGLPPSQMVLLTRWGCRGTCFDKSIASEVFEAIKAAEGTGST